MLGWSVTWVFSWISSALQQSSSASSYFPRLIKVTARFTISRSASECVGPSECPRRLRILLCRSSASSNSFCLYKVHAKRLELPSVSGWSGPSICSWAALTLRNNPRAFCPSPRASRLIAYVVILESAPGLSKPRRRSSISMASLASTKAVSLWLWYPSKEAKCSRSLARSNQASAERISNWSIVRAWGERVSNNANCQPCCHWKIGPPLYVALHVSKL